jgi:aryl-alcohol dehydrogenase-like predicted oxidoreductase
MGAMDKEATFKVLDAFYEAGGRSIDTANNYQNEESETLVGDWLEARGVRDQMVIATKYTSGYGQPQEEHGVVPQGFAEEA